jgi:hypothetical protein
MGLEDLISTGQKNRIPVCLDSNVKKRRRLGLFHLFAVKAYDRVPQRTAVSATVGADDQVEQRDPNNLASARRLPA